MTVYIVATDTDYTVIIRAKNPEHAKKRADDHYFKKYNERRNDWESYTLKEWLEDEPIAFKLI